VRLASDPLLRSEPGWLAAAATRPLRRTNRLRRAEPSLERANDERRGVGRPENGLDLRLGERIPAIHSTSITLDAESPFEHVRLVAPAEAFPCAVSRA